MRQWLLTTATGFGFLLAIVWAHVEAGRLERHVADLQRAMNETLYESARLRAEIDRLVDAPRLRDIARRQWGMDPLSSSRVIRIEP